MQQRTPTETSLLRIKPSFNCFVHCRAPSYSVLFSIVVSEKEKVSVIRTA